MQTNFVIFSGILHLTFVKPGSKRWDFARQGNCPAYRSQLPTGLTKMWCAVLALARVIAVCSAQCVRIVSLHSPSLVAREPP